MDPAPTPPMCGAQAREARRSPDIDPSLRFDKGSPLVDRVQDRCQARLVEANWQCPVLKTRAVRGGKPLASAGRAGVRLVSNCCETWQGCCTVQRRFPKPRQLRNPDPSKSCSERFVSCRGSPRRPTLGLEGVDRIRRRVQSLRALPGRHAVPARRRHPEPGRLPRGALGLLGPPPAGELPPEALLIVAVEPDRPERPAVAPAEAEGPTRGRCPWPRAPRPRPSKAGSPWAAGGPAGAPASFGRQDLGQPVPGQRRTQQIGAEMLEPVSAVVASRRGAKPRGVRRGCWGRLLRAATPVG
jgi:hypothetical protein